MSEMISTDWRMAFAVIGVAFTAVVVWLGIRIFNRRERWAKWTAVGLFALSVIYVVSSGPMQSVAFRRHTTVEIDANGKCGVSCEQDPGTWWPTAYAPLVWASEESWGEPVNWYWNLFPVPETGNSL